MTNNSKAEASTSAAASQAGEFEWGSPARTSLQVLERARALIAEEKHWTRGTMARDQFGAKTYAENSQAVCWCAVGACKRAACGDGLIFHEALRALEGELDDGESVADVNDEDGHETILALFDYAIATAREREGGA